MTERATLEALLARVLEGEGPDRELDAEIWIASERGVSDLAVPPWRYLGGGCWNDDSEPHGHNKVYAPHYTASLDAVLRDLLPEGWSWELYSEGAALLWKQPPEPAIRHTITAPRCATPPRALIAACLKAMMEAQPLSNP